MKKLCINLLLVSLCMLLISQFSFAYKKLSLYKPTISYEQAMLSNKPIALYFHVDWCGYCVKFSPIYDGLRKKYGNSINFVSIDAEEYKSLAYEYGVHSYPSLFLINPKKKTSYKVSSDKYLDKLKISQELYKFMAAN